MTKRLSPLTAMLALGAALTASGAWAQSAAAAETADPAPRAAALQQVPPATGMSPTAAQQLAWADLDADKDGAIPRQDSTRVPSLAAAFNAAGADGDGRLTVDACKVHASV